MTNATTPRTSGADWPPGRTKPPAPRGAPEQSDAFAGMLDQHQARTAIAEGPKRDGHDKVRLNRDESQSERSLERRDDSAGGTQVHGNETKPEKVDKAEHSAPAPTATDEAQPVPADSTEVVADPAAVTTDAGALSLAGALNNAAVSAVAATPATAAAATTAPAAVQVAVPVQTGSQPAVVPAATAATQATTAQAAAVDAAGMAAAAAKAETAVVDGAAAEIASPEVPDTAKPAVGDAKTQDAPRNAAKPAGLPADSGAAGYKQPGTGSEAAGTPARPTTPAAGEHAAAPAAQATQASASQPVQQQQPSGAAGTVNAPQQAATVARGDAPLTTGVPLSRAAETVEHILRLAATRGGMQARVSLKPAELGSLEVVIRQTAGGLTARVVAEDAGAAQVLQQAGSELRRSLESQGITLLNLDIGQSGGERTLGRSSDGAHAGGYENESRGNTQNRSGGTVASGDDISTETTVRLPNGALVDVLA